MKNEKVLAVATIVSAIIKSHGGLQFNKDEITLGAYQNPDMKTLSWLIDHVSKSLDKVIEIS